MNTYNRINRLLLVLILTTSAINAQNLVQVSNNNNEVKVIQQNSNGLVISVKISDYVKKKVFIKGETFYSITNEQGSSILDKGFPDLPKITKSIAIPNNLGVKATIVSSEFKDYNIKIAPSKGILNRTINPDNIPYEFATIYKSNTFYPNYMYDIGEPYLLHDQRGVSIDLYPFAYNPQTQILRVYYSLIIKIDFLGYDIRNTMPKSAGRNKFFDVIYKNHFLNHSVLNNSRGGYGNEKMLIICKREFIDEMQPFIVHKNDIGLRTEIVSVEDIGNDCNKIKQFIKNSYNKDNQLTFVLLVGDFHQITTFLIGGGGSDPSYSLINGDDNYPDIIVGRFSAENEFQVSNMVYKTIRYETAPKNNQAWFNKGLGIASNDGNGHGDDNQYDWEHLREIRKALLNWRYTSVAELYDGNQGEADAIGNPTEAMVANVVNDGVSIINYTGHGNTYSWATSNFSNINVNRLTNTNKLPFIFSVACLNGNFTLNTCFAETWLRAINNNEAIGAIGFYGSSINQSWQPPMEAQDKFNELFYNENFTTFGELCFNGACSMIDKYKSDGVEMFLTWNYFGDPSVSYADNPTIKSDLLVRDNEQDTGLEPNPTFKAWRSPDIWLADYSFNPIFWLYSDFFGYKDKSCYIAVRVKNIGKEASKGNEKLHVHWSNSSLRSWWNMSWVKYNNNFWSPWLYWAEGAEVTPKEGINIPSLQPNEEITLYVLWNLPPKYLDPVITLQKPPYLKFEFPNWGFALMAKIDDGHFINGETSIVRSTLFAKNSNNIAIDNGTMFLFEEKYHQISELGYIDKPFVINFNQILKDKYTIGDFAEVYATLSPDMMRNLNKEESKGIKVIDEMSVLLYSKEAILSFNALDDKEGTYFIGPKVHFISDKMPEYNDFDLYMILKVPGETDDILNFTAIRDTSIYFKAQAESNKKKVVKAREEVVLQSNVIDSAHYVWFDSNGVCIGEGSQIVVTPQKSQKYKVMINKDRDGYRSYDEVEVIAVDGIIKSLSPNPTHNELKVVYELSDNASAANIQISNVLQTLVINYPIDITSKEKIISLTGYIPGTYVVKLIVDGVTVDTRQVIKN